MTQPMWLNRVKYLKYFYVVPLYERDKSIYSTLEVAYVLNESQNSTNLVLCCFLWFDFLTMFPCRPKCVVIRVII
jgi:hypothetical protein